MSMFYKYKSLCLLAGLAFVTAGCQDDSDLSELNSSILVCVDDEVENDQCNVGLNLGERPMNVTYAFSVMVRNVGNATLEVSDIEATDSAVEVLTEELSIDVDGEESVSFSLSPTKLGETRIELIFHNDDPELGQLRIPLEFVGLPEPMPELEFCTDNATGEDCGTDIVVDFGTVRRTQTESQTVYVRNAGNATLFIESVTEEGASSVNGELTVATSTRPGELPPGANVGLVVVYEPYDGVADEITLRFQTTDPAAANATVTIRGTSDENDLPIAIAREIESEEATVEVTVGDYVVIDGTASSDPEGDPLTYSWSLSTPLDSHSHLDDSSANRVSFVPDKAGTYSLELVVFDSLGQSSGVPAQATVQALPYAALQTTIEWSGGGDVDLHLVPQGEELFSDADCYFENPRPDLGIIDDESDDPELMEDAPEGPGQEALRFVDPPDGEYILYVHYFDAGTLGGASVNAKVIIDDASIPVFEESRTLPTTCTLWTIGTISFPDRIWTSSQSGLTQLCY